MVGASSGVSSSSVSFILACNQELGLSRIGCILFDIRRERLLNRKTVKFEQLNPFRQHQLILARRCSEDADNLGALVIDLGELQEEIPAQIHVEVYLALEDLRDDDETGGATTLIWFRL